MGFDDGQIVLDSPNGAYYSGQTIRGNLIFQQDSVKTFRGIYVKFHGFCKVHWTTTETRRVNDRHQTYTLDHDSHEEYANMKIYLVGGESGEHKIQPGNYTYPFTFHLPPNCPSSFEGDYGHIRYTIKAVVDRSFKFDQEKKVAVRVMAPLDLNMDPYCREPIAIGLDDSYCCCCFSSGTTETMVNAPMSGYCPGQKIPIEITCENKGNVEIDHIKLRIVKKIDFIATHHPGRKSDKDTIAEIKKVSIPGNTTRNWTIEMEVPALDIYNVSACRFIDINYEFEVVVSPEGCHNDSEESRRLVIGTVPLVGFQDNVPNPLQDQMPQQVAPVTNQPLSSYPSPSSYPNPGVNVPYPTMSPYPNNPYPVTSAVINPNPPYPSNDSFKSPYGANNTPYPPSNVPYSTNNASNSPYPMGAPGTITSSPYPASDVTKSPYPPSNSPYPVGGPGTVTNSPYPPQNSVVTSPYPTNDTMNSPYPSSNTPYSDNPPPYPGNAPPYPASQPNPIPGSGSSAFGGRTLLKTGNIGFTVQGSNNVSNMPFPGNATPARASPVPDNPYVAASAPALDSPNTEKKE